MAITIWGRENSSNVRKVLWVAAELGLDVDMVETGGEFGGNDTLEYRAMNPNGLVPCMEDDGFILWESNAIVRYLAREYGEEPFTPEDAHHWALVDKWMDWASLSFQAPYKALIWNLVRRAPDERDMVAVRQAEARFIELMGIADQALAESQYLSGDEFGPGDIPLGVIAMAWYNLEIDRPRLPYLEAWYEEISNRPAFQEAVLTPLT